MSLRKNLGAEALAEAARLVWVLLSLRRRQVAAERAQAEREVPRLVEVLGVEPGMTLADVGAGFGAMTGRVG